MNGNFERIIKGNRAWAEEKLKEDPHFFEKLVLGQKPQFLWIGCSDSRVPANEITNTQSGEIFVHRNISNMVVHTDMNLLSVLYYAVEVLKVQNIIICGHYGCGGVVAAMKNADNGFVNNWLRYIKEVYAKHKEELEAITDYQLREDRLVELNVVEQVHNLAKTRIVQRAWQRGELKMHGVVYRLSNGLLKDLSVMENQLDDLEGIFKYEL